MGPATNDKIDENKSKKMHAPKIQDENVNY